MTGVCFFRSPECYGRLDKAHWVPKQALKREAVKDIWAPELWTPMCRLHHHRFDNHLIRIGRELLPPETVLWFENRGLAWMIDRYFPERTAA